MGVCFDLSRSIEVHLASSEESQEKVIGGRTSGLLQLNDEVAWRAKHFVWLEHTSRITELASPKFFTDKMVKGFFKAFSHRHDFVACDKLTLMIDKVEFEMPWGVFGKILEMTIVEFALTHYLQRRNAFIKMAAENALMIEQFLGSTDVKKTKE
jgi:hypothetical protein